MHRTGCIALTVLAACAVEPDEAATDRVATVHSGSIPSVASYLPLRVGIEFLPAQSATGTSATPQFRPLAAYGDDGSVGDPLEIRAVGRRPIEREPERPTVRHEGRWGQEEVQKIEDPIEKFTVHFVEELMGEDRRRMRRELGTPVLTTRLRHRISPSLRTHLDEREAEEESEWVNTVGRGMLRRPLRDALRASTIVDDLEKLFENFKSRNLPMTEAYQRKRGKRSGYGSFSMRLRLSDDPVEIVYRNSGLKLASNMSRLGANYNLRLSDAFSANISCRYEYDTGDSSVRGDVAYNIDEDTQFYMVVGDRLNYLGGPTAYSLLNSPMDGDHGLLFYVEHHF